MHVLHAIAAARRGGAEQLLFLVGRELQRNGTSVSVLFFDDGPLRGAFELAGLSCHVLGGTGSFRPWRAGRIGDLLEELHPDAVHLHGLRALTHVAPVARMKGIPIVYASHSVSAVKNVEYGALGSAYRTVEGWFSRRFARAVVATSARMRDDLASASAVPASLIHVIPPCIDLDRLPLVTADLREAARRRHGVSGRVVGMIGRLIPAKGHAVAVRALKTLPDTTLLVAGDGPQRLALGALARECGVADRVVLLGDTSDVAGVCHASDVVVYPSTEGIIGLAALEAMACGVPVVASDQPGIGEFIEPGRTGLLVTPGDDSALSAVLASVLSNRAGAAALASAGAKFARVRYAPATAAGLHRSLYDSIVCRMS